MKVSYELPDEDAPPRSLTKVTLEAESQLDKRLLYNLTQLLDLPMGKGALDAAIDAILP